MAKLRDNCTSGSRVTIQKIKDWWRLVDTEAKHFYIEHEWSHTDAWRAARSNNGTADFDINGFLAEGESPRPRQSCCELSRACSNTGAGENA